ncbi:MAG: hypothetical protein ACKOC6_02575, partial [bacterium]
REWLEVARALGRSSGTTLGTECAAQAERALARLDGRDADYRGRAAHCAGPRGCVRSGGERRAVVPEPCEPLMLNPSEIRKRLEQTGIRLDGLRRYL